MAQPPFTSISGWPKENRTAAIYANGNDLPVKTRKPILPSDFTEKMILIGFSGQLLDWAEPIPYKTGASDKRKILELIIPN